MKNKSKSSAPPIAAFAVGGLIACALCYTVYKKAMGRSNKGMRTFDDFDNAHEMTEGVGGGGGKLRRPTFSPLVGDPDDEPSGTGTGTGTGTGGGWGSLIDNSFEIGEEVGVGVGEEVDNSVVVEISDKEMVL